jgi:hypothetical protein
MPLKNGIQEGEKMKIIKVTATILLFIIFSFSYAVAQGFTNLSDCLVTNDIGEFTYKVRNARLGNASGVVGDADHFDLDHTDSICNGSYSNISEIRGLPLKEAEEKSLSVKVQVTQHTGGDSDRWLLHELDADFRNYYGIPGKSYGPEQINGQTILQDDVAGANYRWLSGNKVIEIKYRDSQMTKPEPLEIVKAYLTKHPSTISPFILQELRNSANVTKWIKNEMDRRLWLCDKWNAQSQAGGVTQADLMVKLLENMTVFLKYREKYFGVAVKNEEIALDKYHENDDLSSIQKKLTEYKTWWAKHKDKRISI